MWHHSPPLSGPGCSVSYYQGKGERLQATGFSFSRECCGTWYERLKFQADNIHSPAHIQQALAENSWWAGAGQEAAECPGSKAGQEQPGLCAQDIKDRDYPGHWGLVWVPQGRKDVWQLEQGEGRASKVGLEPLGCEERLRELGLSSPEQGRLRGS